MDEDDNQDVQEILVDDNDVKKNSKFQTFSSDKIGPDDGEDNNDMQINQGDKEIKPKTTEEPKALPIYEPMSKGNIFLMVGILIIIVIIVVVIIVLYLSSKDSKEDSNKKEKTMKKSRSIRLKNWEFTSSENVTNKLTPEQISKGDKPELF